MTNYQTLTSSRSPEQRVSSEILRRELSRRNLLQRYAPPPTFSAYWQARYPKYQYAPHVALMVERLAELQAGEAIIITVPPRHGKSQTTNAWLEWQIGQHPDTEVILASYSVDLARRHSRQIRNEIAYGSVFSTAFPGVTLAPDSQAATDWALTQGGRFKAAGVGVGITGMGARFAVIDDPIKDRKAAESDVIKSDLWEWFTSALLTRLSPDACLVLMHTRWADDDLAGQVLARLQQGNTEELGGLSWSHLSLPALAEADDPLGREEGEPLWPERYNLKRLEGIRDTNPYDFASLYQQRPQVRGGTVFLDGVATYQPGDLNPAAKLYITVDTASSKRETADFSALTAWAVTGRGADAQVDVLENVRQRLSITEFLAVGKRLQGQYLVPLHIEQTSQSLPIIQYLRSEGLNIIGVPVKGDKFTRAQPYAAAWNQGRVRLPAWNPAWVGPFKSEHLAFTGTDADVHDDCIDTGSQLMELLNRAPPGQTYTPRQYKN